ncbi:Beta-N-acetylhexosaminidase [Spironucleus salmonicida]|uniref:beta-N-acetylhexosaminidase n=1 Tax=Spironucleus salmonicida TaxID=348837 RepID=V6M4D3_9EUKA|nr:Beta-N-acetylhexosaminidase [Spironucleus salmonicida]|eukprot:EST48169.1 Glycosyl hydrolase family 20 protein [Spironucleus salmonicida]
MILLLLATDQKVFPTPKHYELLTNIWGASNVSFNCTFQDGSPCHKHFEKNYIFFQKAFFPRKSPLESYVKYNLPTQWQLQITVDSKDENYDILSLNESYSIVIDYYGVVINASTGMALSRAFQSLSQMIVPLASFEHDTAAYIISKCNISDSPSFKWREIAIDISQNYLNQSTILQIIDGMAITKFNILHIKSSDDISQSIFFSESPQSNLNKACFSENHALTIDQLQEIQSYALERGVIVYLEIDMPINIKSWQKADRYLLAQCDQSLPQILNPANPNIYKYIKAMLKDLIFNKLENNSVIRPIIHFGGSGLSMVCWDEDSVISSYKLKHNLTNEQLLVEFNIKVKDIVNSLYEDKNLVYTVYNEAQAPYVEKDKQTIIHFQNSNISEEILQTGVKVIQSFNFEASHTPDHKYFDEGYLSFYQVDLLKDIPEQYHDQIIGGGVVAENGANEEIVSLIFSKAAAVAEILWANPSDRNSEDFEQLVVNAHCKLQSVGLKVSPTSIQRPCPGYFWKYGNKE